MGEYPGLDERPKQCLRGLRQAGVFAEPFQFIADEKIHGRVFIANVGATRATVDFFCNIFYWKESSFPTLYPYDTLEILRQEPPIILERGQRITLHGLAGGPLSKSVIDNIGIGKTKLYVMGWVQYKDDRNVIRETRFCRLWNNSERRFTVVDNPDYEYSKPVGCQMAI